MKKILLSAIALVTAAAVISGCSNTQNDIGSDELKEMTVNSVAGISTEAPTLSSDLTDGTKTALSDEETTELDSLLKKASSAVATKIEEREWTKYSCSAAKSSLTGAEATFYDRLREVCGGYLDQSMYQSADFSERKVLRGAKYSDLGLSADEAANVAFWFRLNNPQYFFLDNSVFFSSTYVYFCLGDFMNDIEDPAKTANELFAKLDEWIEECGGEDTAALDKMLAANSIICTNTARSSAEELGDEYKSIYSVLMNGDAVCTGYALTFCSMANAMGIKTFTAQSGNYVWNVFEADDKNYYYADICLNDKENSFGESCLGIGTEYTLALDGRDNTHVYSDIYAAWLPTASQESLELFSQTVSAPAPRVSGSGGSAVKLEWDAVENAQGYEYLVYNEKNIVSAGIVSEPLVYVSISSGINSADVKIRTIKTENTKTAHSDWAKLTALYDNSSGRPAAPADVKAEMRADEDIAVTWKNDDTADDHIFFMLNGTLTDVLGYSYSEGKSGVLMKGCKPTEDCYFKILSVKRSGNVEIYSDPVTFRYNSAEGLQKINEIETGRNIVRNYSDGVYVGDLTDGKRNGTGTMTYSNGNIYSGEWSNDIYNGKGKLSLANGTVYEGEFSAGEMSGSGKMTTTYTNGDISVIEGAFEKGQASGQVIMKYSFANGASFVYNGEYKSGNMNGAGVKTTYTGGNVMEETGTFVNGNLSGTGTKTVKYGSGTVYLYEGDFVDGKFTCTGKRTIKYSGGDKSVIEGNFTDSDISGQVKLTYTFARGSKFIYEGEYSNNALNGQGIKTTYRTDNSSTVEEGTFRNEKLYNGVYTQYSSDGSIVVQREYVNGQPR